MNQITLDDISLIAYDLAEITYKVCRIEDAITDRFLAYIEDFTFGEDKDKGRIMKKIQKKYYLDDMQMELIEGSFEHMAFSICYLNENNKKFLKRLELLKKEYFKEERND